MVLHRDSISQFPTTPEYDKGRRVNDIRALENEIDRISLLLGGGLTQPKPHAPAVLLTSLSPDPRINSKRKTLNSWGLVGNKGMDYVVII